MKDLNYLKMKDKKLDSLLEDILQVSKELDKLKPEGIYEIRIIKSPMVKDGYPTLLVSEKDYELFKEMKDEK